MRFVCEVCQRLLVGDPPRKRMVSAPQMAGQSFAYQSVALALRSSGECLPTQQRSVKKQMVDSGAHLAIDLSTDFYGLLSLIGECHAGTEL